MKTSAELLREYKKLLDQDVISENEYDLMKKKLLAKGNVQHMEAEDIAKEQAIQNKKTTVSQTVEKANTSKNNATTTKNNNVFSWLIIGLIIVFIIAGLMSCGGSSSSTEERHNSGICSHCNGTGYISGGAECQWCNGTGYWAY